jgi:hypothetical protein
MILAMDRLWNVYISKTVGAYASLSLERPISKLTKLCHSHGSAANNYRPVSGDI